jgi:hypothetical protein
MEKLWWWIIESWDFNLSTETAHAKLRRVNQLLRCPVQSPTIRTYDIHFSHVMNCPIWVKWLMCQGQRRLDRRVGRMRGIDSWMKNLRLWNLRLCQWNREIGMRRRKDRKRQDISNRNKGLRDLWMMHLKRLKRW